MQVFGKTAPKRKYASTRGQHFKIELSRIQGAKILLVEDNEINQQVTQELLSTSGMQVSLAENGQVAVQKCQDSSPSEIDLIFMDLEMPVLDGYEATKQIRRIKGFENLPIVALTADAMSGVKSVALKVGMNDYITKPIDPSEVYNVLVKWIPAKRVNSEMSAEIRPRIDTTHNFPLIPGIDTHSALKRIAGNIPLYSRILLNFAEQNIDLIEKLRPILNRKNFKKAEYLVHALKGSAGNVGAQKLYEVASAFDTVLKSESPESAKIAQLFQQFNAELSLVIQTIKKTDLPTASPDTDKPEKVSKKTFNLEEEYRKLINYLSGYDARAGDIFNVIKGELSRLIPKADLTNIAKSIEQYDYDQALNMVKKFIETTDDIKQS